MNETAKIQNTLREYGYSDRAIKEVLKWYVDDELGLLKMNGKSEGCRSRMDVIECILEKTIGGSEKAHVMQQCNLTNAKFQLYLDFLLSVGFIREVGQSIETAEKGLSFLKDYRNLKRVIDENMFRL